MADWDTERIEQSHLRERLNDIAADVSRLVYAVEGEIPRQRRNSARARSQTIADDLELAANKTCRRPQPVGAARRRVDRMAALRELQERN